MKIMKIGSIVLCLLLSLGLVLANLALCQESKSPETQKPAVQTQKPAVTEGKTPAPAPSKEPGEKSEQVKPESKPAAPAEQQKTATPEKKRKFAPSEGC